VLLPLVLVVLAGGFFAFQAFQARSEAAAARRQLLEDVERATRARPLDSDELSRLVARMQKFDDFATARDLVAATVRVEMARGRVDRAAELFAPVANQPGATPAEQRLAAIVWLRRHEAGLPDRTAATAELQQAIEFAENAYADGQDAADLTVAWLAASRLPDHTRADRFADQLRTGHASSPGCKLANATRDFRLDMPRGDLEVLRREFDAPPAEIDAMLALVVLQAGDLPGAVAIVDPCMQRAPGVLAVRWAAALVFHTCALGSPEGSDQRTSWRARRDAQLDWLVQQAPADDERRPQWAAMREAR
jgi:hypothetical protein